MSTAAAPKVPGLRPSHGAPPESGSAVSGTKVAMRSPLWEVTCARRRSSARGTPCGRGDGLHRTQRIYTQRTPPHKELRSRAHQRAHPQMLPGPMHWGCKQWALQVVQAAWAGRHGRCNMQLRCWWRAHPSLHEATTPATGWQPPTACATACARDRAAQAWPPLTAPEEVRNRVCTLGSAGPSTLTPAALAQARQHLTPLHAVQLGRLNGLDRQRGPDLRGEGDRLLVCAAQMLGTELRSGPNQPPAAARPSCCCCARPGQRAAQTGARLAEVLQA